MRVHVLQHLPFEGLGDIATWVKNREATLSITRFWENSELPAPEGIDMLIIMGGSMSTYDEDAFPWLKAEKEFIRNVIQRGTPALGVCLGAQLMASALGARVYPNLEKEIGWWQVDALPVHGDYFRFPSHFTVFQWHGDTFDLPKGATHLVSGRVCANQVFQYGSRALALQFHIEATPAAVKDLVDNCGDELRPGFHIQDVDTLLSFPGKVREELPLLLTSVLDYLVRP